MYIQNKSALFLAKGNVKPILHPAMGHISFSFRSACHRQCQPNSFGKIRTQTLGLILEISGLLICLLPGARHAAMVNSPHHDRCRITAAALIIFAFNKVPTPRINCITQKNCRARFSSLSRLSFGGKCVRGSSSFNDYSVTVQYSKFGCPLLLRVKPFTRSETNAVAT